MDSENILVRTVRLARIPHYLQTHPKGLTTKELAELCGVSCRTIQRDLIALQTDLKLPIIEKHDRYLLAGDYILPPVAFTLYESVALFLASRLALRQSDERNPHLKTALSKMAKVLPYPLDERVRMDAILSDSKKSNARFIDIYERVAFAWMVQRRLIIEYQSLKNEDSRLWELEPYFIEMTGVGFSSYVIGHGVRAGKDGIFTFKLDRIKKAKLTGVNFAIPATIDIGKLLSTSWGIIWGDDIEVILKFAPNVTRRVKESIWHPSQVIKDLPDGGCRLKLKVGSLLEITPWIRSWGPDVEVVEPEELREQFREWVGRLGEMYDKPVGEKYR